MFLQQTLKKQILLDGVGLHSGKPVRVRLCPAPTHAGIVFVRTDLEGSPEVSAHYKNIVNTQLATTLGLAGVTVSTVEHLLAALQGAGVDNVRVELDGPEVPVMDGSAAIFYDAIQQVGVMTQLETRPILALRKKVEIKIDEKWAVAAPSARLEIHGSIEWDHPLIGYQEFHYQEGKTPFEEIAAARTFGFLRDVDALKSKGLARGGSLENAVVLDQSQILNPGGLRYTDEFVRHKVLDALGDFKLAGIAIQGFFRLHRAGHDLHSQLLTEIFKNPDHFEIIDGSGKTSKRVARIQTALARGFVAGL